MTDNTFKTGTHVEALVDAQGLVRGYYYLVVAARTTSNFTGAYTTYDLQASNGQLVLDVVNGHLVLKQVSL